METEAVILRARAELAKLAAEYTTNENERERYRESARAFEAQAIELEDTFAGWKL